MSAEGEWSRRGERPNDSQGPKQGQDFVLPCRKKSVYFTLKWGHICGRGKEEQ